MVEAALTEDRESRQFVKFTFYKVDPKWRALSTEEREAGKAEFASVCDGYSRDMIIRPYSLVGLRGDVDFMLWKISQDLEKLQEIATRLSSTRLGPYLHIPYSYLAMTRRSIYVEGHSHQGQEGTRLQVVPGKAKYLMLYPFVKTRAWYHLTKAARQGMMDEHIAVGHKYHRVKINTTYSFGLDDQEFVLAFETDYPSDFLDLVMELRETEASMYTLRDTPIFTGIAMGIREALDRLGG